MVNYETGKIYKLYSPSKNIVYIGSTTQPLCKRLSKHLGDYRAYNKDNNNKYLTSYLVLECEDYKIELLEEYACNNKQQLEKKEGEYIKNNTCINKNIAGRTKKEWSEEYNKQYYKNNKEEKTEYNKNYFENNKEKYRALSKRYRENNKEQNKERIKEWKEANKEKIAEKRKQYYLLKKK